MSNIPARREAFYEGPARDIAAELGASGEPTFPYGGRFAVWRDGDQQIVVVGRQEGRYVQQALARVLQDDELGTTLVLPRGGTNATLQRLAWVQRHRRPQIATHSRGALVNQDIAVPSQAGTVKALADRLAGKSSGPKTIEQEWRRAATVLHHGTEWRHTIAKLTDHVAADPRLVAAHRQSYRAWHFQGQQVLKIGKPSKGRLDIIAGIGHTGADKPDPIPIDRGEVLTGKKLEKITDAIDQAVERRTDPEDLRKPDEHWLQAVLRHKPEVLGLDQPVLREVPAWRPSDKPEGSGWGRGYLDLAGIDAHGTLRLVETKVLDNKDLMFVLQGLDYYIWARAYKQQLAARLGVSANVDVGIDFVVGAPPRADAKLHAVIPSHMTALDPSIETRLRVVRRWYSKSGTSVSPTVEDIEL